jgi:nucleoside-diphosphate-sugar epimerase
VAVTGHTGFKGSRHSHCLKEMGATVHGYDLAPEMPAVAGLIQACLAETCFSLGYVFESNPEDWIFFKVSINEILEFQLTSSRGCLPH